MTTEYLLHREVEHVLAALTPENRVIMRLCMHTGLRIGDVLAIKTAQLAPRFWITEQKTGKRRMVGLPAQFLEDMRKIAGPIWVFSHAFDPARHRTRQAVWKDVKRAARAFRLPQNVAPHSARKIYAVDLLAKYEDIERVQRALNHSSQSVTLIYAMADRLLMQKFPQKPHDA